MDENIRKSFDDSPEIYTQLSNKDTLAKARGIFSHGLDAARSTVEKALGAAQEGRKLAPELVPLSRMAANELSKQGNIEAAPALQRAHFHKARRKVPQERQADNPALAHPDGLHNHTRLQEPRPYPRQFQRF